MTEGAVDRLLTLAALLMTAVAVADPAEALWKRWKASRDARLPGAPGFAVQAEPAWFAQARAEIDRMTHG